MKQAKRYTITAALPYANGPIHIGQLAGAYISPDIFTRYLRLKGKEVVFICGSDENGIAITLKALKEGKTPQEIVDYYHELNKKSFHDFGISFDIYHRTSSEIHHKTAAEFFKTLYDKGEFIVEESEQYYDEEYHQYLADRYISGCCPICNHDAAYGDQCEKCGSSLNSKDLINPVSTLSGKKPILKKTTHWYLPMQKFEPWLKEWILEEHKHDWKKNVYGQCKSWLEQGLQPRAMTRDLNWGVKVPLPGAEGKVLYVWLDAPIGYISATKAWAAEKGIDWKPWWQSDDTRLIHFIGKDNIVFHCIIFPIILKAHGDYILPDNVPANEFMNMEGDKISTSRNWAVWLHEYLEDFPDKQDVLRYVLTANMPETKDSEFTWKDFQSRNNNELVAVLGNFVNRTLVLTQKYCEGKIPVYLEEVADYKIETIQSEIKSYLSAIENHLNHFRFRAALNELMGLARFGNKFLADAEPWKIIKNNPEQAKQILYIALQICASLCLACEPFLPLTAKKMAEMMCINTKDFSWDDIGRIDLLKSKQQLPKPGLLFEKIEDGVVEQQITKLKSNQKLRKMEKENIQHKPLIDFNQFENLELLVGTIKTAEKVPKTDKLLQFTIDLGSESRTILSGIADQFDPEEMIGKQVCIVANLKPRKIKGIESEGMILMAENKDGKLSILSPSDMIEPGSVIS